MDVPHYTLPPCRLPFGHVLFGAGCTLDGFDHSAIHSAARSE
jgi:hypothetical protein